MSPAATWRRLSARVRGLGLRRARRWLGIASLVVVLPVLALVVAAALEPLPPALVKGPGPVSLRVLDRNGRLIRELRSSDGQLARRVPLSQISPNVLHALIAAEDIRFRYHPGVDPIAIARAFGQMLWHRRIVSGASTITQQLARALIHRPRTLGGKLHEMAVALRIEASLSKNRILEEYLNRIAFGPNLRGIEAASRFYFDKPASKVDLAEAATLVAIPRGPTLYDPLRGTERVRRRRDRIIGRMLEHGLCTRAEAQRARAEPVRLERGSVIGGAYQLVRGLTDGELDPRLFRAGHPQEITSTIDGPLEREVAGLVRQAGERMAAYGGSAAAAIVVDNASGDVLAYVGSPDFFSKKDLGQNDGVSALRQPGSTLKPFVYAVAMQRLGMTAATLLPDVELHLPTAHGDYSPHDYDGRFHGPVRLRVALGSSLNVPAVYTASLVGPGHVLELLHRVGFVSLKDDAEHYGVALALGDGEVRLYELAGAYAALARGGVYRPLRFVRSAKLSNGRAFAPPRASGERVIDPKIVSILTDILSDNGARIAAFGRNNVLEFPFPVAAKTGTSKGYRDNWTVGFTHEVTVAVWVGNFDGTPMTGSSGVTGAGPLFHDVMIAAMREREHAPLVDRDGLVAADICPLSGELVGPDCSDRVTELFRPGHVPSATCTMHERVAIDPENDLRAGPHCPGSVERVFEVYPPRFASWAAEAGRPTAPESFSPRCPGNPSELVARRAAVRVQFPFNGASFSYDPALSAAQQELVLSAAAPASSRGVRFVLDGKLLATVGAPYTLPWGLKPGAHTLSVETLVGARSEAVHFSVE
jgi:penicillin-binding protein 1C